LVRNYFGSWHHFLHQPAGCINGKNLVFLILVYVFTANCKLPTYFLVFLILVQVFTANCYCKLPTYFLALDSCLCIYCQLLLPTYFLVFLILVQVFTANCYCKLPTYFLALDSCLCIYCQLQTANLFPGSWFLALLYN